MAVLKVLFANGQVLAVQPYTWDGDPANAPVPWDGSVSITGPITIGTVDQGAAGVDPWLVTDAKLDIPLSDVTGPVDGTVQNSLGGIAANTLTTNQILNSVTTGSGNSLAVTGPLTDAELRATPVPISGTVTATVDTSLLATSANQVTAQASLSSIDSKLTSPLTVQATDLDIRNLTFAADKVDVSGSLITATVDTSLLATSAKQDTANASLASIAAEDFATETTLAKLTTAQGDDSSGVVGPLIQGIVNDSPSSFNPNVIQPLSLTTEGRLRVSSQDAYLDKIWQNTFDTPWGSMITTVANSDLPFAGEVSYV